MAIFGTIITITADLVREYLAGAKRFIQQRPCRRVGFTCLLFPPRQDDSCRKSKKKAASYNRDDGPLSRRSKNKLLRLGS